MNTLVLATGVVGSKWETAKTEIGQESIGPKWQISVQLQVKWLKKTLRHLVMVPQMTQHTHAATTHW